jgi:dihydropteroate synthase
MTRIAGLLDSGRPVVMAILNVTPDSFSDGGEYIAADAAVTRALEMISEGADIIDIGGESTRPGASAVSAEQELARVMPVIEALRAVSEVPISIDTSKAAVMTAAAAAGVDLINDVYALRNPGALAAAAASDLPVCLMHMQGEPRTMQQDPQYADLIEEIKAFFAERIAVCESAGIRRSRLILDIGFGFGKTPTHNLQLINRLAAFADLDLPLLVGLSRKSTIGSIVPDGLIGSIAGALLAVEEGARMVRVHDVAATVHALRIRAAIRDESIPEQSSGKNGR